MTVDEMRDALRAPGDVDTEVDLGLALQRIHDKYAVLLLLHYRQGWTQREAMRLVRSRSWQDWKRAEQALMREVNDGETGSGTRAAVLR